MSNVVSFKLARINPMPMPTALVVEFDFGQWTIRFIRKGRFLSRRYFVSEEAARAEAARLVEKHGIFWSRSPKGAA